MFKMAPQSPRPAPAPRASGEMCGSLFLARLAAAPLPLQSRAERAEAGRAARERVRSHKGSPSCPPPQGPAPVHQHTGGRARLSAMAYYANDEDDQYTGDNEGPYEPHMEERLVEALGHLVQDSVNWALIKALKPFTQSLVNFGRQELMGDPTQSRLIPQMMPPHSNPSLRLS
ncbi:hypothetical protein NDU88_001167 [Pleurodeles waltl]|uniref:Uncharacterized protein n=1 Tax=Pleurodeles waltl TaxID=8319 RepID=A0AAV7WLV2_PLEWA|nr:hypothetical protein NDU88_001167 [Pleurodeles waltl]